MTAPVDTHGNMQSDFRQIPLLDTKGSKLFSPPINGLQQYNVISNMGCSRNVKIGKGYTFDYMPCTFFALHNHLERLNAV